MNARNIWPGIRSIAAALLIFSLAGGGLAAQRPGAEEFDPRSAAVVEQMLRLLVADRQVHDNALAILKRHWQAGFAPMILEVMYLSSDPGYRIELIRLLEEKTGQRLGFDISAWYEWLWNRPPLEHPHYADFKAALYGLIDSRFAGYFSSARTATIRLDEVRWGGVLQDGIPPLRRPRMIRAGEADYLDDGNVVFGLEVNNDARAYPKRIMGWHEMFVDEVGGVPVAGVYCTLCGTMILYKTVHDGVNHALGTSGFLYRSNKLMYDQATQSLWNTLWGRPVIGPLAERDITLERSYLVTTTWGEWRRRHPDTLVLSLDTGHRRDYGEGVAYREYFATDELMFTVPRLDRRLKNKDEVLGLIFSQHPDQPLAIAADYLKDHPIHHDKVGDLEFVVLTDRSGANRVYETRGLTFTAWDGDRTATDAKGGVWTLGESQLTAADGRVLYRLPAQRAFWFGWFSAYGHTRLVN
ncbi:MAG: DUF3179 domain-containing protein [Pseudomonadota bacterium]|nr:DUF3179 domain-containing protein [Pseudomonadota bacterium]